MTKIVDLKELEKKAKKSSKTKTTTKKITWEELTLQEKKYSQVKTVEVEVDGDKLTFEIDSRATTMKKQEFLEDIKAIALFLTEDYGLTPEQIEVTIQSLILSSVLKVFTDIEVPVEIVERPRFLSLLLDLGLLEQILTNMPDGLHEVFEFAEQELEKVVKTITDKLESLQKEADELKIESDDEE